MKVKTEKLEKLKVKITVTLSKEEFDEKIDKAFENVKDKIEIPGFRKGHVSKAEYIKRKGVESLYQDAFDLAINDTYIDAVKKSKVTVVSEPEFGVNYEVLGNQKGFEYYATVERYPDIELGNYLGVEVKKDDTSVTDEEIEDKIKKDLKLKSDLEVSEGKKIETGDTAVIDFVGSVNGVEFEGGKGENYSLEIGSHTFIPGFEEQLIGMKENEEKVIKVTFPENYTAELASKDADFKVLVHEVKTRVYPNLDEDFVKEMNIEGVTTVDEYKASIKRTLEENKEKLANDKVENDIFNKVIQEAKFEVPESTINYQINLYNDEYDRQAKMYNIDRKTLIEFSGMTVEQYEKLTRERATEKVKFDFVIDAIIKKEDLKLDASDYESGYEKIASQENLTVKEVKAKYPKNDVKHYFLNMKAYRLVIDSAIVK